jgi:apolipoprotein N-acyltransferase
MRMVDERRDSLSELGVSNVSNSRTANLLLYLIPPLLSAGLLTLAFPRYNLGWLGWVALVPLLSVISGRNATHGFFQAFLCGMIFFVLAFDWVFEASGYTLLHHLLLCAYMGLYFGLFGTLFSLLCKRRGVTMALFSAPFIWVLLEYLRSNMGFMALPYAWLGFTQYAHPLVIQIASVAGAYGISFVLATVNSAVTALLLALLYRSKNFNIRPNRPISNRGLVGIAATAAFFIIFTLCYGMIVVSNPTVGKKIKVSVVQGNIEQAKKWDRRYRNYILETYEELSREASKDQPTLIIWPEAATPGFVLSDFPLKKRFTELVREINAHFLIGSSEYPKLQKPPLGIGQVGNTALFFSPDGKVMGQYLKIHLLPFAEYVPYQKLIPWPQFIVPKGRKVFEAPGSEMTLFDLQGAKFGALICWENIFPELFRSFVKEGAHFMVNITNEAWFGKSVGPQHYLISSVFRAVENRVYVVRCANTGISCFIDPYGRVVDRVKDKKGQDIFVRGVLTETVIPLDSRTVYTRYGDWLVSISAGVSLIFISFAFLRRKPEKDNPD